MLEHHAIGKWIRSLRTENGWTQEDLAAKSGVSLSSVQRAERGEPIAAATISSIASAFGMDAKDLTTKDTSSSMTNESRLRMTPITSGGSLIDLLKQGRHLDFIYDEVEDAQLGEIFGQFYDFCSEHLGDAVPQHPSERIRLNGRAASHIKLLGNEGYALVGTHYSRTSHDVYDDGDGMAMCLGTWREDCCLICVAIATSIPDFLPISRIDLPDYSSVDCAYSDERSFEEDSESPPF